MNKQNPYRPIDMTTQRVYTIPNGFAVHNATKAACIGWPAFRPVPVTRPIPDRRATSILPSAFHLPKAQAESARRNANTTGTQHSSGQLPDALDPQIAPTTPPLEFAKQRPSDRTDAPPILPSP